MNVKCPHCETSYQIDLPENPEDATLQCAKCNQQFSPVASSPQSQSTDKASPEPENQNRESAPESGDSANDQDAVPSPDQATSDEIDQFLGQLVQEEMQQQEATGSEKIPIDDSAGFLDDFLNSDMDLGIAPPTEQTEDSEVPVSQDESQETGQEAPSEEDLPEQEVAGVDETGAEGSVPATGNEETAGDEPDEDEDLDDDALLESIWKEAVEEGAAEAEASPPREELAKETTAEMTEEKEPAPAKTEESFTAPEMPEPAPDSPSPEEKEPVGQTAELSEDDLWAQALDEQDELNEKQAPAETLESVTEAPPAPPVKSTAKNLEPPEDLLGEALAGLDALNGNSETEEETIAVGTEPAEQSAEEDDMWAQAFSEQDELNDEMKAEETPEEKSSAASAAQTAEQTLEPAEQTAGEDDMWAQAFSEADGSGEEQKADSSVEDKVEETVGQPADAVEENAELSEEDLWAQAFAGQEDSTEDVGATETASALVDSDPMEDDGSEELTQDALDAALGETGFEEEAEGEIEEEEHETVGESEGFAMGEDYDDEEEDDFPTEIKKKRNFLSFLPPMKLPETKSGKMIMAGSAAAILLIVGGGYFAMQTLAPTELRETSTPAPQQAKIPDLPVEPEKNESAKPETPEPAPANQPSGGDAASQKTEPASPETEGAIPKPAALGDGLAKRDSPDTESQTPESATTAETQAEPVDPQDKTVSMGAIMPVAFNATDLRVLSFTLELELENGQTAALVRESLPVFEKIMVSTVEQFLGRTFYNDILYVKEKLQKKLMQAMNKSIKGGKVKKVNFKEFEIG